MLGQGGAREAEWLVNVVANRLNKELFEDPTKPNQYRFIDLLKDLKQSTRQRFVALEFDYPSAELEAKIVVNE